MQDTRGNAGAGGIVRQQMKNGLAALQDGRADEARDIFSMLLEGNPDIAVAQVGLGRTYAAEGDHQKALEHFQAALKIKPDFATALMFAAQSREKLGMSAEAMEDYSKAVELDPKLTVGVQRMARMMVKEDRDGEALSTLKDAVARSPQDAGLRLMYANALEREGEPGAEAEYRRVIELKPDLWIAHYQLGRAYLSDQNFAAARDCLLRAASLAADKAQVHQALGSAYAGLGDHAKAAKAYDEAYKLKPTNLHATVKAAEARAAMGKYREALDGLLGLGRMAKRSMLVQRAMGDVYFAMGKWTEAAESYVAMILNAENMEERSPDLVKLANAPEGSDPEVRARQLHDALRASAEALGRKVRANPKLVRNWLRDRRAGRPAR